MFRTNNLFTLNPFLTVLLGSSRWAVLTWMMGAPLRGVESGATGSAGLIGLYNGGRSNCFFFPLGESWMAGITGSTCTGDGRGSRRVGARFPGVGQLSDKKTKVPHEFRRSVANCNVCQCSCSNCLKCSTQKLGFRKLPPFFAPNCHLSPSLRPQCQQIN